MGTFLEHLRRTSWQTEPHLLHGASVGSHRHPQLQETAPLELVQGLRGVSGVGLPAPRAVGLGRSALILAQQHGEVEAGSVVQLVVYLQAGAVELHQGGVGHRDGDAYVLGAGVLRQLGGQGAGRRSQAQEQLGQRESEQLHRAGRAGDVIAQHHAGFTQQDPDGQLGGAERKQEGFSFPEVVSTGLKILRKTFIL